jgi:hypothetical protein
MPHRWGFWVYLSTNGRGGDTWHYLRSVGNTEGATAGSNEADGPAGSHVPSPFLFVEEDSEASRFRCLQSASGYALT